MGIFSGGGVFAGGKNFLFGSGAPGKATNQINLANELALLTRNRGFNDVTQSQLDLIEGQRTGAPDTRTDGQILIEVAEELGDSQQFIDEVKAWVAAGEPPGFGGEGFRKAVANRLPQIAGRRQNARDPSTGFGQFRQPVIEGGSIAGVDRRIGEITDTESFKNLRDERTRALQGQLAASGLQRSGAGFQSIADLTAAQAFDIENKLFGRDKELFGIALGAQGNIDNIRLARATNQANLQLSSGRAEAQGTIGTAQEAGQNFANLINTVLGAISGGGQGPEQSVPSLEESQSLGSQFDQFKNEDGQFFSTGNIGEPSRFGGQNISSGGGFSSLRNSEGAFF